jgi:tRNA (guanine37-N1)-methyltransferase
VEIDILSLFPAYFAGPFDESIIKQARKKGLLTINQVNIRDFAEGKHKKVDDRPYGGGPGMVMMPEPLSRAIKSVRGEESHVIYLSPQGRTLTAKKCEELSQKRHLILVCGHYEGIDERVIDRYVDEEISIGDYVLTNGGLAAIVLVDAVARFIPGVLGHSEGVAEDSFEKGILDYPHYTQPLDFEGVGVPEVLLQGHHGEIAKWRRERSLEKTKRVRADLYLSHMAEEKRSEGSNEMMISLPVRDERKSLKFYKGLGANVGVFKSDVKEGVVLTLFVKTDEDFEALYRKVRRECEVKIGTNGTVFTFQDLNGYGWVVQIVN